MSACLKVYSRSGKETRFIEELAGLQVHEPAPQLRFGSLSDSLKDREGHLCTNDGGSLEEGFLFRGQAVDARRQDSLHCGRHLNTREGLPQAVSPRLTHQDVSLD